MADMSVIDWIARILVIVGAINIGFAVWDINLLANLGWVTTIAYILVAISGIWEIISLFRK